MPAPAYSLRAVLLIDGEWRNVEVGTAVRKAEAETSAQQYAEREGRVCYVFKLVLRDTKYAGPEN